MSGICGIVNLDGAPVESNVLAQMAEAAAYRGPDGIRYWIQGNVGLANLALIVTPEAQQERQPVCSADGLACLTADTRVDNRDDLINRLAARGYLDADARTDADLILAAYRCWGESSVVELLGDFVFAIWDTNRRGLLLARDAMGRRGLYYRAEPRRVLFASEIKQILAVPGVPARLFEPAVAAHLVAAPGLAGWTCYDGIATLPPAHALSVSRQACRTWRYWDIDPEHSLIYRDERAYAEHLLQLLKTSVRACMRSISPVGVWLSGGLDSQTIAAVMGTLEGGTAGAARVRPYSWAFSEQRQCDERWISDRLVEHFGWQASYVPAEKAWTLSEYPSDGPDRDSPLHSAYYALQERTRRMMCSEHIRLSVTGSSADPMIGPLVDYVDQLRSGQWRQLWRNLRADSRRAGRDLGEVIVRYLLKPLVADLLDRVSVSPAGEGLKLERCRRRSYPGWLRADFAHRAGLAEIRHVKESELATASLGRRQRYLMAFGTVQGHGSVTMQLAHSRHAMDHADPGVIAGLPSSCVRCRREQYTGRESKHLAREVARHVMPESVRSAARITLPTPFFEHSLTVQARSVIMELLKDPLAASQGYVAPEAAREHYAAVCTGQPVGSAFWQLLTLEMWLRRFWHQ